MHDTRYFCNIQNGNDPHTTENRLTESRIGGSAVGGIFPASLAIYAFSQRKDVLVRDIPFSVSGVEIVQRQHHLHSPSLVELYISPHQYYQPLYTGSLRRTLCKTKSQRSQPFLCRHHLPLILLIAVAQPIRPLSGLVPTAYKE